jgi:hypothetical protein
MRGPSALLHTQTSTDLDSVSDNFDSGTQVSTDTDNFSCALCHSIVGTRKLTAHVQNVHSRLPVELLNCVDFQHPSGREWSECNGCRKAYLDVTKHRNCRGNCSNVTWAEANGELILDGSICPLCPDPQNQRGSQFARREDFISHVANYHNDLPVEFLSQLWPDSWSTCRFCSRLVHADQRGTHDGVCTGRAANAGSHQVDSSAITEQALDGAEVGAIDERVLDGADDHLDDFVNGDDAHPVANLDDVAIDLSCADAVELVSWFHYDLWSIAPTWHAKIRDISYGLLRGIVDPSNDSSLSDRNLLAFFLFPGIIEFVRRKRERGIVTTLLDDISSDSNAAVFIIKHAQVLRLRFPHQDGSQADPATSPPQNPELRRATQRRDLVASFNKSYKNGRLKQAKSNLMALKELSQGQRPPERLSREDELANVRNLFPAATARDTLPAQDTLPNGRPLPPPLQISPNHVRDIIPQLDTDTSAGVSGFTMAYFKLLFGGRAVQADGSVSPPTEAQTMLAAVYNRALSNSGTPLLRALLTGSRVVVIPKKNDETNRRGRPLGIGEVVFRVLGKIVGNIMGKKLSPVLAPLQIGVGVKDACAMIPRILQGAFDRGLAVLAIDFENAFSSIPLGKVYEQLLELAPELIAIFRFSYGAPGELRNSHGELIHMCCTGLRQGDPLAVLLFCIGIHALLVELDNIRQEEIDYKRPELLALGQPDDGLSLTFIDDRYDCMPVPVATPYFHRANEAVFRYGLRANFLKFVVAALNLDLLEQDNFVSQIRQSTEGLIALGVPVGQRDYVYRTLQDEVQKRMLAPEHLLLDQPAAMFRLLSVCVNPSIVHHRRATSYESVKPIFQQWDEGIEKLMKAIFDVKIQDVDSDGTRLPLEAVEHDIGLLHNRMVLLLRAPRALGGLGVSPHFGMEAERAELIIRLRIHSLVLDHPTLSVCQFPDPNQNNDTRIGKSNDYRELVAQHTTLEQDNGDFYTNMRLQTAPNQLQAAITAVYKALLRQLLERLGSLHADRYYLAYLRSILEDAGSGPMAWAKGWFKRDLPGFKQVLQMYFGFPSIPLQFPRGRRGYRCMCQFRASGNPGDEDPSTPAGFGHPLCCLELKGRRNERHKCIVSALVSLIKDLHPDYSVAEEIVVGHDQSTARDVRADIVVKDSLGRLLHVIDVAVVTPACSTYTRDGSVRADRNKDAAAAAAEAEKRRHYERVVAAPVIQPFVLEATGRFGPAAKAFTQSICGDNTYRRSQFLTQCSWVLAVGVGQMVDIAGRFLRAYD